MDPEKDQLWRRYKDAMSSSARLAQQGKQGDNEEALRLLDSAIVMASKENDREWFLPSTTMPRSFRTFLETRHELSITTNTARIQSGESSRTGRVGRCRKKGRRARTSKRIRGTMLQGTHGRQRLLEGRSARNPPKEVARACSKAIMLGVSPD